jgi:hypothetical protein
MLRIDGILVAVGIGADIGVLVGITGVGALYAGGGRSWGSGERGGGGMAGGARSLDSTGCEAICFIWGEEMGGGRGRDDDLGVCRGGWVWRVDVDRRDYEGQVGVDGGRVICRWRRFLFESGTAGWSGSLFDVDAGDRVG